MHATPFNLFSELIQGITLIKILVAVSMVVILSLIAEFVSPRAAGILSGYPLGAAIVLFFIGFEISPTFASQSAVYTMVGLVATLCFVYTYYRFTLVMKSDMRVLNILMASGISIAAYTVAAYILKYLKVNIVTSFMLGTFFILLFDRLFKQIPNAKIKNRLRFSGRILLLRAFVAAIIIVLITTVAKLVGPAIAGLFSAFPITMLPFIAIIHFTYDPRHVHSIIKNVPRGIFSLLIYALVVALSYPSCGVYFGTLIAYIFATLYLIMINVNIRRIELST
jgi:hypothetical protein